MERVYSNEVHQGCPREFVFEFCAWMSSGPHLAGTILMVLTLPAVAARAASSSPSGHGWLKLDDATPKEFQAQGTTRPAGRE